MKRLVRANKYREIANLGLTPKVLERIKKVLQVKTANIEERESEYHDLVLVCSNRGRPVSFDGKLIEEFSNICKKAHIDYAFTTAKNDLVIHLW